MLLFLQEISAPDCLKYTGIRNIKGLEGFWVNVAVVIQNF